MYTPRKATHRVLNSSYTPFSSLASSKVSTNCDFQREDSSSMSKKKFSRKREGSSDSLKKFKAFETDRKLKKKQNNESPQEIIEQSFEKAEKLLQKLSIKKQYFQTSKYVKLQRDRSQHGNQESSMNDSFFAPSHGRRTQRNRTEQDEFNSSMIDYRMELEMKNSEFMILQDQNSRMKKQLKNKEIQINKLEGQKQDVKRENQMKISTLNEKIKKIEGQIMIKDQSIEKAEKSILKGKQLLRKAQNENEMLKIHIDQLMNNKIPKNALQIISYREMSLQNKISDLKNQLNLSKSQRNFILQAQLIKAQEKLSETDHTNSSLSIVNRVLIKKTHSNNFSTQKKINKEITELKQKVKEQISEVSALKKQNVKLRKEIYQHKKRTETSGSHYQGVSRQNRLWTNLKKNPQANNQNASDDSFSFSLSR